MNPTEKHRHMDNLCELVAQKKISEIDILLDGSNSDDFIDNKNPLTLFHWVAIHAILYTEQEFINLCAILLKYRDILPDTKTIITKKLYLHLVRQKKYNKTDAKISTSLDYTVNLFTSKISRIFYCLYHLFDIDFNSMIHSENIQYLSPKSLVYLLKSKYIDNIPYEVLSYYPVDKKSFNDNLTNLLDLFHKIDESYVSSPLLFNTLSQ